jgi:hypothetical protein
MGNCLRYSFNKLHIIWMSLYLNSLKSTLSPLFLRKILLKKESQIKIFITQYKLPRSNANLSSSIASLKPDTR